MTVKMPYLITSFSIVFMMISLSVIGQIKSQEFEDSINRGQSLYTLNCVTCHMANGEGVVGVFPPLAKADYLMEDTQRAAKIILHGINGQMKVNDVSYFGAMIGFKMTDEEVADVLNYIRNSWGNTGSIIKGNDISEVK
jgi:mono/diheme cytochrome c family protein